jgi:glycosyltransferase involved in cell wall biosynthesis
MRILHVVPTYLPATRYGGTIYATHALCRALAERGVEVEVATTNTDGVGVSDVPLLVPVERDGIIVRYFSSPMARRLYWSPSMRRFFDEDVKRFDLLHLHSVFLWPTLAAARSASDNQVPYVLSPRGMLIDGLIRAKSAWVKRAWIEAFEKETIRRAAAVHFTSEVEKTEAARMGLPLPATFVVPNGVDLPRQLEVPRSMHEILYLGRINWKKGIDRAIAAMPLLPEIRLIVAGNDEEQLTPQLQELTRTLGVADRVYFVGEVTAEAKWELLFRAGCLILPSQSENFGNVVLEAMAARCPVVVTPEVGAADVVSRFGCGWVTPSDPSDLARAIEAILGDPALNTEMGNRGRKAVEAYYSWTRIAEMMIEQYEGLIPRP